MPRTSSAISIDQIVHDAMEGVIRRASAAIARAIAQQAAAQIDRELERGLSQAGRRAGRPAGRAAVPARGASRPRLDITKWSADRRARRVPTFVIELTGLKTKKEIVKKYGENATFEKGKPGPKAKG